MRDPHTQESRGFGFVKMVTPEQADAAREGLQGENMNGRTLSIEKARRARPRTPTPGRYFGPPKRGTFQQTLPYFSLTFGQTALRAAMSDEDTVDTERITIVRTTVAATDVVTIMDLAELIVMHQAGTVTAVARDMVDGTIAVMTDVVIVTIVAGTHTTVGTLHDTMPTTGTVADN